MNAPQLLAKQIGEIKYFNEIYKNGCCALVLLWCLGIEPESDFEAVKYVDNAIKRKVIEPDCLVKWAPLCEFWAGRTVDVAFIDINNITDIKERTPVKYMYKGACHWVGVENGLIKFDPYGIGNSQIVANGRPTEKRVLTLRKWR